MTDSLQLEIEAQEEILQDPFSHTVRAVYGAICMAIWSDSDGPDTGAWFSFAESFMATAQPSMVAELLGLWERFKHLSQSEHETLRCAWIKKVGNDVKAAIAQIVTTSSSDEEIVRRIGAEFGYSPDSIRIHSHTPTDDVGREAREIVRGLGGLVRKDGAMVMLTVYGPHDTIDL